MATTTVDFRTIEGRLIKDLAEDGMRAVMEAIRTNEFENRTGNLEDSYASAVYKNGRMVEGTEFYLDPKATKRKKWYGKELSGYKEAVRYLRTYTPRSKGISLVVIAAMPYGEILEQGAGNLLHKYKVITGANTFMRQLAKKYEGRFGRKVKGTRININPIS